VLTGSVGGNGDRPHAQNLVVARRVGGSTFKTTITHKLNMPAGIETTMAGGPFASARVVHSSTPRADRTKVDLEGHFPAFPGRPEADELKMIDGFFSSVFSEDSAILRRWYSAILGRGVWLRPKPRRSG
jgi:hypothetical protein